MEQKPSYLRVNIKIFLRTMHVKHKRTHHVAQAALIVTPQISRVKKEKFNLNKKSRIDVK
jgi:hypothetical protein